RRRAEEISTMLAGIVTKEEKDKGAAYVATKTGSEEMFMESRKKLKVESFENDQVQNLKGNFIEIIRNKYVEALPRLSSYLTKSFQTSVSPSKSFAVLS
ncbi:hypothetical protein A2U01_0053601, partial [Trifolium medium]|nr:hypothetical protein [Trifolium medium]